MGKRWAHIYEPGETLPLKTSVSSLVRGERERLSLLDAPEEETPAEKRQGSAVVPLLMEELPALPAFLRGEEFTGARRGGKLGLFELANEGVILLDEINSLSLSAQAKLLRVLQERRVDRVGGDKSIPINVRVIAISNCPLELSLIHI